MHVQVQTTHLCVPKRPQAQLSGRWDTGAAVVLYYDVIEKEEFVIV